MNQFNKVLPPELTSLLIPVENVDQELQAVFGGINNAPPSSPIIRQDSTKIHLDVSGSTAKRIVVAQDLGALSKRGVTGTVVWNSSLVVVSFLQQIRRWRVPWVQSVVELGSGNGLTAVAMRMVNGVPRIVCTDNVMESLALSRKNVIANVGTDDGFEFVELDWHDACSRVFSNQLPSQVDVLLASDVLYNESIVPDFCNAVSVLSRRFACPWMVFQELRSDSVHRLFLENILQTSKLFRVPLVSGVSVDDQFSTKFVVYIGTSLPCN